MVVGQVTLQEIAFRWSPVKSPSPASPPPTCSVKKIKALTSTLSYIRLQSQKVEVKRLLPRFSVIGLCLCAVVESNVLFNGIAHSCMHVSLKFFFISISSTAKLVQGQTILISHCQSNSLLMPEAFSPSKAKRFISLIHAAGEHLFELSCLGLGFYRLSNIHLAGLQLCMKGWWR